MPQRLLTPYLTYYLRVVTLKKPKTYTNKFDNKIEASHIFYMFTCFFVLKNGVKLLLFCFDVVC